MSYGLSFCIGIVMARLLTPSDYGIAALPAVFLAVAGIFQNCGMGAALIRKERISESDLSTAFFYSIAVGLVMYIGLFLSAPFIADFYNTPILTSLIRVTALTFLWGPLSTVQYVLLKRQLDFKTPTIISFFTTIISATIGISMAFYGYGVWALVISGVTTNFLGLVIVWFKVKWYPKVRWSKESFNYLWGFGNKMMVSSLLDTLYKNIAPVFIGKVYSTSDLGVYNRAQGYAALPSQNITGVIQNVTFPVLSKLQNDTDSLAYNYRRMLKATAFIIFPLMLMLSALAYPLVIILVTAKWEECIILLQIICFSMMWYPIHAINLNLLQVKGRSDLFLRLEIIKKVIGVSVLIFTLPMGLVPFCIGNVLTSILCLIINTHYTGRLINVGFIKQMKDLFPILGLGLVMFALIHLVTFLTSNLYLQLLCGGAVGFSIYLGGAILFRFQELEDIKYMLKRK